MAQLLFLQVIVLFGAAQISKLLSHLIFVQLCINSVSLWPGSAVN